VPHMAGRPLTLKRYPDGVDGQFFYEKKCPSHRPEWFRTVSVWSGRNQDNINYCVVDDLPSLVWVANMAGLELHTSLALADDIHRPTMLVFDLDPGAPATIKECCNVGLQLRDLFAELKLKCFAKTSGSKGLQVYVPLNTPVTYEETKPLALAVAQELERKNPQRVLSSMSKELRKGKVFVDWSQNDRIKTTVGVYSLRARDYPTVSTPVTWEEVEECLERAEPDLLSFLSDEVLTRYRELGDLFLPVQELKQKLPELPGVGVKGKPRSR